MITWSSPRRFRVLSALALAAALLTGCGAGDVGVEAGVGLPVGPTAKISWSTADPERVTFSAGVTFLGMAYINATVTPGPPAEDRIRVILRDTKESGGVDRHFDVEGASRLRAVLVGVTVLEIQDHRVLIDLTDVAEQTIEFTTQEAGGGTAPSPWRTYWKASPYSPLDLARGVYDDTHIGDWYGAGFLLFLVRLIGAVLAGLVDLLLMAAFALGGLAYLAFGQPLGNIVVGVAVLVELVLVIAWLKVLAEEF
ncbi:hypothetical protein [Actinosynnema sp. NPDC020468]|uniref:hypothetical protein n=1 Tax=Actinosynnema sp. NPDC020468 TaxID=3154488 RepID=UPI0033F872CC